MPQGSSAGSTPSLSSGKRPALVLQHDAAFGPGRLLKILGDFGIPTDHRLLHQGDAVPTDLDEIRLIVSLGGHERIADQPKWLDAELTALQRFVAEDRPVLGLGLGAQLLAKAAGAEVREATDGDEANPQPIKALGWQKIKLPFPGGTDPIVFGLAENAPMFMWQRDTFDLPKLPLPEGHDPNKKGPPPPTGNALISSVPGFKNAAYRFKNRLYGFAWQPELMASDIDAILKHHGDVVEDVEGIRQQTQQHADRSERLGIRLLTNFVQFMKAY
jgi:GMP synthase-like glutamine amidotransferase